MSTAFRDTLSMIHEVSDAKSLLQAFTKADGLKGKERKTAMDAVDATAALMHLVYDSRSNKFIPKP